MSLLNEEEFGMKNTVEVINVTDNHILHALKHRYCQISKNKQTVDEIFPSLNVFTLKGGNDNIIFVEWHGGQIDTFKYDGVDCIPIR